MFIFLSPFSLSSPPHRTLLAFSTRGKVSTCIPMSLRLSQKPETESKGRGICSSFPPPRLSSPWTKRGKNPNQTNQTNQTKKKSSESVRCERLLPHRHKKKRIQGVDWGHAPLQKPQRARREKASRRNLQRARAWPKGTLFLVLLFFPGGGPLTAEKVS